MEICVCNVSAFIIVAISLMLLTHSSIAIVQCDANSNCPDGNTCCSSRDGGFACCADEEAGQGICCADELHCCANGYTCQLGREICIANDPLAHPLAQHTNLYSLCPAVIPAAPFLLPRLVGSSNLRLPYYASPGALGEPDTNVKIAIIVVHGTERNADDYFCSMLEAVRLQRRWATSDVMIVAPRFTEPKDNPPLDWLTWNGTGLGDWRKGGNSTLHGKSGSRRASLSSYAVLDALARLLSNTQVYPALEELVMTGHSAGGQTVQRYALATSLPPTGGKVLPMRYVVANPSSFAYMNSSRWVDIAASEGRPTQLRTPQDDKCPDYNHWHYGITAGYFTPYVAARFLTVPTRAAAVTAYSKREVVYLMGQNDTCNEDLTPGCQSHDLDKSCSGMAEGRYRRERAGLYYRFLHAFYANWDSSLSLASHDAVEVPGVGHDHTNMFQSKQGLAALFRPAE